MQVIEYPFTYLLYIFLVFSFSTGIVLGTADHFTHERTFKVLDRQFHGNAFYENENATSIYKSNFCTQVYVQRAVQIIKKHDKKKVSTTVKTKNSFPVEDEKWPLVSDNST